MNFKSTLILTCLAFVSSYTIEDVAFNKIGTYSKLKYFKRFQLKFLCKTIQFLFIANNQGQEKTYFIPRYFTSSWANVRAICKSYDMDFVSLDTEDEADNLLAMCKKQSNLFGTWTHIGAITLLDKRKDFWFWVNSGKHIDYTLKFYDGRPDNLKNVQHCLTMGNTDVKNFFFDDISCNSEDDNNDYKFVCERRNNPEKVKNTICSSSC